MGQSFKFISCLSSEFCRDYDCMLQDPHSVIRASQCTEHWVRAIQNIKIDPCASHWRLKENLPLPLTN